MKRLLVGLAALAFACSGLSVVALSQPAGAAAPQTCKKAIGTVVGAVTLKGCSGGLATGTFQGSAIAAGGAITWKKGKKGASVLSAPTATNVGQGGCGTGSSEYDVHAVVVADTSGIVSVGSSLSARFCLTGTSLSLVKHTTVTV